MAFMAILCTVCKLAELTHLRCGRQDAVLETFEFS